MRKKGVFLGFVIIMILGISQLASAAGSGVFNRTSSWDDHDKLLHFTTGMLIGILYDDVEQSIFRTDRIDHPNTHAFLFGSSLFLLYELSGNKDTYDLFGGIMGLGTGLALNHFLNKSLKKIRVDVGVSKDSYQFMVTVK